MKLKGSKAYEIADRFRITIYQEMDSHLDFITSLQLDKYIKDVKHRILCLIADKPTIYFAVEETEEYWFINYLIYHPFDWADYSIPIIGKITGLNNWLNEKDSHRHDTEALCLRIAKDTGIVDIVTVSHFTHLFDWNCDLKVIVEAQSHAIRPYDSLRREKQTHIYHPDNYKLDNLGDWSDNKHNEVRETLKKTGVNWIDGHYDGELKLSTATGRFRSQGLQHYPGDIYNDPDKLFKIGEKLNR